MSIKETLLDLSIEEKEERMKAEVDYYFYKGKCEDKEKAKLYKPYLGQNWEDNIERDYEPTQDIRNKVKPLLKKQARWMFSVKPDILINPINSKDKDECEKLRQWIDKVLDENKFWNKTRQAFLMATIKKRTMLRLAAGNGKINIRYEDLDNFSYKRIDDTLIEAKFFQEDLNNAVRDEKIYYLHTFYYKKIDEEVSKATYRKETYKDSELVEVEEQELGFEENKIPCWLIINGGDLGEEFGETDLYDLKVIQQEYNKRVSDVADAIKFGLFGVESVIDGNEDDVNKLKKANVLIVGLGGVGGYALETLVRSGIYNLTIVDGDIVELSNLNRQIISKRDVIGKPKALVAQARTLEINPDVNLKVINEFISEDNFSLLNIDSFDYVIDACDDLNLKLLLIKNADKYKLISSMGTANKMDMTRFKITTIDKTSYDPLAKIIRKKIKEEKIRTKFKVVSSDEKVMKNGTKLGTVAYMPAISGLLCASYVINDIIDNN